MWHRIISLLIAVLMLSLEPSKALWAASNPISAVHAASQSMVKVKADFGGLAGKSPNPALDPKTGRLFIKTRVQAYAYSRSGAGIIFDSSGLVVTNAHTVENAQRITIIFSDDTSVTALPVYMAPQTDLALLKVDPPYPLTPIPYADSEKLQLGETVYTVGNSKLLDATMSEGRVVGMGVRQKNMKNKNNIALLELNFGVYKGDSGTPILNGSGEFLGFVWAGKMSGSAATYAVPSASVKKHYDAYLSQEKVST